MYQKKNLQQLKDNSLEEIKAYKEAAVSRKAELENLKAQGGKNWKNELQEELDEIAVHLVDVEEIIESRSSTKAYTPKKGTEKMVHLSIIRGRRFNPMTGKEESTPYTQLFTFPEWQLFKKNYKGLGFTILSVLHDPYGDAAELITNNK